MKEISRLDEHSRVKLIPQDDFDPGYINANFISVSFLGKILFFTR